MVSMSRGYAHCRQANGNNETASVWRLKSQGQRNAACLSSAPQLDHIVTYCPRNWLAAQNNHTLGLMNSGFAVCILCEFDTLAVRQGTTQCQRQILPHLTDWGWLKCTGMMAVVSKTCARPSLHGLGQFSAARSLDKHRDPPSSGARARIAGHQSCYFDLACQRERHDHGPSPLMAYSRETGTEKKQTMPPALSNPIKASRDLLASCSKGQ